MTGKRKKIKFLSFFLILNLGFSFVFAQQTYTYHNPESAYTLGVELVEKKLFSHAQEQFLKVLKQKEIPSEQSILGAKYYYAYCAARLGQKQAEYLLTKFISENSGSTFSGDAKYELALLNYQQKKFRPALKLLEEVDAYFLSPEQNDEYYFKLGYCYFSINEYEKASKAFFQLKDKKSDYGAASAYYYAHIAYQNKNYETALQAFLTLTTNADYSAVVPFYISQIYYLQEKYEALISYASPLLQNSNPQNSIEISRMIGEAYFRQNKYRESIPYLKTYLDNSNKSTREDYYQLGYANYRSDEFSAAVALLEKSLNLEDALTQHAYFVMADCFLKLGKKQNARNAFRLAAQLAFDKEVQDNALFNYAKLSYELSIQSDAVEAFQKYKRLFPESDRLNLANQYLAGIFLTTKNYKDALLAMEGIKNMNEQMKTAYQRTAYFRALEFFNDVKYHAASELFEKSLIYPRDPALTALAHYWQGEALFNMKSYQDAIQAYNLFLFSPQASSLSVYNTANYNIGYCYFKKADYPNALTWFRKYLKTEGPVESSSDKARRNDAVLRSGDCFFIHKDYSQAAEAYEEALQYKAASSDYAWFQRAMIYGIQQKMKEKINTLQILIDSFPASPYFDDALYESGRTMMITGDNEKAMAQFRRVVDNFQGSSYVGKALTGIGLIYYNNKQDEFALNTYKKVVKDFPGTPESRTALMGIKNIYVSQGNAAEYLKYSADVPFADNTKAAQDSITYESAEVVYMKGDCEKSINDFSNYIDRFPDGSFVLNATFYKSECQYRAKKYEWALHGYETVIAAQRSTFTETSLLKAATIYFTIQNYEKALETYNALSASTELKSNLVEAETGKMRCQFLLKNYNATIESAMKMDTLDKVTNELKSEAHLSIGRSAMLKNPADTILAFKYLEDVSKESSVRGAEAKYLIASVLYSQGKFSESQKTIFSLVNQVPSYDDWVAKGFVLLADDYLALGDPFQAKATLQSIINNYDGDDKSLIPNAIEKLNQIVNKEKQDQEKEKSEKLMSNPDSTINNTTAPEHE